MKQPPHVKSLAEATESFLSYSPADMTGKYQLERMRQLMDFLGNPQNKLRVIHIAGTSGKTSTAYFIRGILEAAGQKTGLTVSPHIVAINERVQIGGQPLSETVFLKYVNRFFGLVSDSGLQPTYFELLVALAYWVFEQEQVDYAVVETGLGGLLDGTNVVTVPDKVCVITDIGLDHTEILGDTIEAIAAQKAGIIQNGNHVFVQRQANSVLNVIAGTAKAKGANVEIIRELEAPKALPAFQHRNWSLAITVAAYIARRDQLHIPAPERVRPLDLMPPGRWETYHYMGKTLILDGAHNPQKLEALCESLRSAHIRQAAVMANLVAAPEAKIETSLTTLQPFAARLIVPEFAAGQDLKSRRSLPATKLARRAAALGFTNITQQPELRAALRQLLQAPEQSLLITGSLYLVSAIRPLLLELTEVTTH